MKSGGKEIVVGYKNWIKELKLRYKNAQIKASISVNKELLTFYFELGKDISEKQFQNTYGSEFYKTLSHDLQAEIPDAKGFSSTNLKYAFYFYELYSPILQRLVAKSETQKIEQIRPQLVDESQNRPQVVDDFKIYQQIFDDLMRIPWGHHRCIIDTCKGNPEKAFFYVRRTIENNWSRNVLLNFLDTNLYEREGKAITNFLQKLPAPQGDLAQQITKDPYNFDFLSMREKYDEKELKDALIHNIEKFLLELGRGFAYMGREYRLNVGNTEQFLDMLFYNTNLRCYVVVEVKTGTFESGFIGQLGTYVASVNHILKTEQDNPTLGILVCKNKDNIFAKFALESSSEPLAISEYELNKLYPENFKSSMPTIEELEEGLAGLIENENSKGLQEFL